MDAFAHCQQATEAPTERKITSKETRLEAFKDVLHIVNFNWPFYNITPAFLDIYKPNFPNIAFYGPNVSQDLAGIVREVNTTNGFVGYKTLVQAMHDFPDYAGYLYTNDDVVLNRTSSPPTTRPRSGNKSPSRPKEVHDRSLAPPLTDYWH